MTTSSVLRRHALAIGLAVALAVLTPAPAAAQSGPEIIEKYRQVHRLKDEGKCAGGNPLEREGKIVSGRNKVVSDGPFAESKETIGGYFLLTVGSMDEAVAIAQQCPGLPYGIRVEVRPIAAECPMVQEVEERERLAHA